MKQKLIGLFMTLLVATTATAADFTAGGLKYSTNDDNTSVTVTGATDDYTSSDLTIPASVTYSGRSYPVTAIGDSAFYICRKFNGTLTIPNTVTTIGEYAFYLCNGLTGSLTIPNNVTAIGSNAFSSCSGFKGSLILGNSLTSIGDLAFNGCSGFTGSLNMPNTLTSIGNYAFRSCNGLSGELVIPNTVTFIGQEAFCDCIGFTGSLIIPNSVITIGDEAFRNCSGFTGELSIGNSVTSIGRYAFSNCSYLRGPLTIGNSVNAIGEGAFYSCQSLNGSLTIPNSVVTIGDRAFYNCQNLNGALSLSTALTSIGKEAFSQCTRLAGPLTIPNSVTTIEERAFVNCVCLTGTLTIPNSVTSIGESAFANCYGFTSINSNIVNPSNVTLGRDVFQHIKRQYCVINVPNGCVNAYKSASQWKEFTNIVETGSPTDFFTANGIRYLKNPNNTTVSVVGLDGNGIPSIEIPATVSNRGITFNVSAIADSAFYGCNNLISLGAPFSIPSSISQIGNYAFYGCANMSGSITISNIVTIIGDYAFYGCSGLFGSLIMGNAVISIGNEAFNYCSGLNGSLTIPASVTNIGRYAFASCFGINSINNHIGNPSDVTLGKRVFSGLNFNSCVLFVPSSSVNAYKEADQWKDFVNIQEIGSTTDFFTCNGLRFKKNEDNVFVTVVGLDGYTGTTLIIPSSVTHDGKNYSVTAIGEKAFYSQTHLTGSLNIPNSVTTIGNYAFRYCRQLNGSLTLGNSVTSIGTNAFYQCGFTGALDIPSSTTEIGDMAFSNCAGFTSLSLPETLRTIGIGAFRFCTGFTGSLNLPNSLTTLGSEAFSGCTGFSGSLTIPSSITNIGYGVFSGCTGFSGSLTIPHTITSIGHTAFNNCSGFTSVATGITEPANVTLGNDVFKGMNYSGCTLYVPKSAINMFRNAEQWNQFSNIVGGGGDVFVVNGLKYRTSIDDTSASVIGKTDAYTSTSLTIPASVTYSGKSYPVTTIGDSAFYDCREFTGTLTIPNTVTTIGKSAFYWCMNLTGSLTLPTSLTTIGEGAFYWCEKMTGELTIPNTVTSIGERAFYGCSGLTGSLNIPNSVNELGEYAFGSCSGFSGSLTLSNSLETINKGVFSGCSGFTGSLTIPNTVKTVDEYAFSGSKGLTSVSIPNSLSAIASWTFSNCEGLTNLTIPNTITSIGIWAFSGCKGLTSVSIPNSVKSIGRQAFYDCSALANITLPNTLITLGQNAFDGTAWYNNQPDGMVYIGSWAYKYKGTIPAGTSIVLNEGTKGIADCAFYESSGLTEVTIPSSVALIGQEAFGGCTGITAINNHIVHPGDVILGDKVFNNMKTSACVLYVAEGSVNEYKAADQWKEFGNIVKFGDSTDFFTVGGLRYKKNADNTTATVVGLNGYTSTSLTIPASVTYNGTSYTVNAIGDKAFVRSTNFTGSLTIPNTVTRIEDRAFMGCSGFTGSLVLPTSLTHLGVRAFKECSGFTGSLNIPSSLTSISDYAFASCSGLNGELVIPNSITSIGKDAFWYCSGFTGQLSIPSSVTSIGIYAFYGCSGFTGELTIPASLTVINEGAFGRCSGLTGSLNIPNTVTTIGAYAFNGCEGFTGPLTLPTALTVINDGVFQSCTGLTGTLTIPGTVTSIGESAFRSCRGFTGSIVIPESVTTIGSMAFDGCTGFNESLIIPNTVTKIGNYAFRNCNRITSIESGIESPANVALGYNVFVDMNFSGCKLIVPNGTVPLYRNADQWNQFTNIMESNSGLCFAVNDDGVTASVVADVSSGERYHGLVDVFIPSEVNIDGTVYPVTAVASNAFLNNTTIRSIDFGTTCHSVYYNAFANCTGLTSVHIPQQMRLLYGNPFSGCYNIETMTVDENNGLYFSPEGSNAIIENDNYYDDDYDEEESGVYGDLLAGCKNTVIPDCVEGIWNNAFRDIITLERIVIPDNVYGIENDVFRGCSGLKSITFGKNVEEMGVRSFWGCTSLVEVKSFIPDPTYQGDFETSAFDGLDFSKCVLYVPTGTVDLYRNTPAWSRFIDIREMLRLESDSVSHMRGEDAVEREMAINLFNEEEIAALQFDIELPEGITLVMAPDGLPDVWLDDTRKTRSHTIDVSAVGGGKYRILATSTSNKPFKGTEGPLVYLATLVERFHPTGEFAITLSNIILTEPDETEHKLRDYTIPVLFSYMLGDANADAEVDVADYVTSANHIMEREVPVMYEDAADVSGDNDVTVTDLVGITNIILGIRDIEIRRAPDLNATSAVADATLAAHAEGHRLVLRIDGLDRIAGAQLDVTLPEGVALTGASVIADSYDVQLQQLTDTRWRVLVSGITSADITAGDGWLTLELDGRAAGEAEITDVILSERDLTEHRPADITVNLDATGLNTVAADNVKIFTEGGSLVIVCDTATRAQLVNSSGASITLDVSPGRNVYPLGARGVYIVRCNGTTVKLLND